MQFVSSNDELNSPATTTTTTTVSSDEYDIDLVKNIFNLYDNDHTGYITIEAFLTIIKENWPLNLDDNNLKNLVNLIDPYKNGQLNYQQFLNGIAQMTQLNNDNTIASQDIKKHVNNKTNHNKYDEVDRNSNGSAASSSNDTFNEYDTLTDSEIYNHKSRTTPQIALNDDTSLVDLTNSNFENIGISTTPKSDNQNYDENYEDYGTLETQNTVITTHNNINDALSSTSSLYSSAFVDFDNFNTNTVNNDTSYLLTSPLKSNIKSSKKRASELYRRNSQHHVTNIDDYESNVSSSSNNMIGNINEINENFSRFDENLINDLEQKIRNLENQNDQLKVDKLDYLDRYSKLQLENASLIEKLHEIEELSHEHEKTFKYTIESEKARYTDYINKLNIKHSEEKDVLLAQVHKNESDINYYKDEISKYTRQINELNRTVDAKTLSEYQIDERYSNLKGDYQRLIKERDLFKEDIETLKTKHNQRVDALTKELNDSRNLLQQSSKRRGTVLQVDESRIKELELELQQQKNECKHLQLSIEELEARLLRNSLDAGKILLTQANVPSLAAEMETLSKDELMEKLKNEQSTATRYREYVERILAVIMERNPEILEIRSTSTTSQNSAMAAAKISSNKSAVTFSKY